MCVCFHVCAREVERVPEWWCREMQITDRDEIDAAAMHDKVRDTLTRK